MTKQDILDYFKDIDTMYNDCTKHDTLKHMLDELQEPCDDAISRKDALFVVRVGILSTAMVYGRSEEGMTARREIEMALKALPPVTPAEKVGHWISIGDFECRCSECHLWCYKRNRSRYCPSCGAKMQEVNNAGTSRGQNNNT